MSTRHNWENNSTSLYYQVFSDNREIVPTHFIGDLWDEGDRLPYDIENGEYTIRKSEDGSVFAVVLEDLPHTFVAIHDFTTNESYPADNGKYGPSYETPRSLRVRQLRQRIIQNNPELGAKAKINDRNYLEKLDFLDLSNSNVDDSDLKRLTDLPNLETLHLAHTDITDDGLKHLAGLSGLIHLSLWGTEVTDDGLEYLGSMKHLKYGWIDLTKTHVTQNGLERLRHKLPDTDVWFNGER